MLRHAFLPLLALSCLSLASAGCSKPVEAPKTAAPAGPAVEMGAPNEMTAPADPAEAKIAAELAKLSDADRTAAMAQRNCPVSDERLGSMPGVAKVTVEGRDVFICCEGCKGDLEADPAKFMAKLDATTK